MTFERAVEKCDTPEFRPSEGVYGISRVGFFRYAVPEEEKGCTEIWNGGEYIDKKENVLLSGNPGTDKTHLACALAFAACAQGRKVRFITITKLVTELIECWEVRRLQRLQKQLQRLQLLVLDELGYVPFTKTGAELLFEVIKTLDDKTVRSLTA